MRLLSKPVEERENFTPATREVFTYVEDVRGVPLHLCLEQRGVVRSKEGYWLVSKSH